MFETLRKIRLGEMFVACLCALLIVLAFDRSSKAVPETPALNSYGHARGDGTKGFALFQPPAGLYWWAQIGTRAPHRVPADEGGRMFITVPDGVQAINLYYSDGKGRLSLPRVAVVD